MEIRAGRPQDAAAVLALFDEAVEWLVARGQTGQWGSEPFSAIEARIARATEWAAGGGLRIAEHDATVVGALVLGAHPGVGHAGRGARALHRGARDLARPRR